MPKYFKPFHKGTKIPAFELSPSMVFATKEDCIHFLKQGNPFYSDDRYDIVEHDADGSESITLLDKNGNLIDK